VNFRVSLRKLSSSLLDYQLTGKSSELETVKRESLELKDWLHAKQQSFISPEEREAFEHLQASYDTFLAQISPFTRTDVLPQARREGFANAYEQIRQDYRPVLQACDEVVQAEHGSFDVFLQNSEKALGALQRILVMSVLLLVALALAVAILVYRGMIA